ncbi:DUF6624 domain-containing protein [Pontibacter silvestris]|uniref:DUF6624 domain-containing protein n=1 Tax=Pontibacter silvestris TaxID=2305183 RepID=A0ABW4WZK1_9BACT|nr:DUF6624 domain-containing protein [Pontibacter silvestris]MCC9138814.1 hypothetical protein [Pontibacter silvestris]
MRKVFIIILYIMLSSTSIAQSYQELVKHSFNHLKNRDEEELAETCLQLFSAYAMEQDETYSAARAAAAREEDVQAFALLHAIVQDSSFLDEVKKDTAFVSLHTDRRWRSLIEKIQQIDASYDADAKQTLEDIHASDQGIRLLLLEAYQVYGRESQEAKSIRARMKMIDEVNAKKIQELLQTKGWLGLDRVGELGNQAYFLAIQHVQDSVVQHKYLPLMRQAVEAGNAAPWQYAFLQDRILMNEGKFQIYGTQKILSDDPTKSYLVPLQYPQRVDELRAEVGLKPLKEALAEEGFPWDLEDYSRRLPQIKKMYRKRFFQLKEKSKK